ncbi:MAG: M56 family metallopeptidase [Planctomycetes bacterium]|nr:M56 family metallopeptidase [Planctomycetota bacterium]
MRDYFDPDWTEYTFGLLMTATWQAAVLVIVAALGSLCTRRAVARSAIWTACTIGLALTPLISASLPHVFLLFGGELEPLHFPSAIARPHTAQVGQSSFWTFSEGNWSDGACRSVVYIWLAGVLVSLARLAAGWFHMVRRLRLALPCRNPRVLKIVERLVQPADRVTVLELFGLVGAICWQIHRPKIVLPADSHRLSDSELDMLIRHELAHVRRSDPGTLFLQRLVKIFYWFHPLTWWVTWQTSRYREFVCDDLVLATGHGPMEYAQCLGQLAVGYYAPPPLGPAGLGMVWSQHLVLQRVNRLVHGQCLHTTMSLTQRVALCAIASVLVLVAGVVRFDLPMTSLSSSDPAVRWTAWPPWSAGVLDTAGIRVRDFPLDGHRYDRVGEGAGPR